MMIADDRGADADRIVAGREHKCLLVDVLLDDLSTYFARLAEADRERGAIELREDSHRGLAIGIEDGHAIGAWLRNPTGAIAALSFWPKAGAGAAIRSSGQRQRVRVPRPNAT